MSDDSNVIQLHRGGLQPYAQAAMAYLEAGWPGVIPVPLEKSPPPDGFTGASGRYTTPADVGHWAATVPGYSVALRMPDGVIGIDVDDYVKGGVIKQGAKTLAGKIAEWGPLPPTWSSTARGAGQPSRILLYRVPPQRYAGQIKPDIEIIQRHHRYAVVWPSPHPEGGTYTWYDPSGAPMENGFPHPGELPELPERWVQGLAEGAAAESPAASDQAAGLEMLAHIAEHSAEPCIDMARAAQAVLSALDEAQPGSRHDTMTEHVYQIVMLAAEGHPGAMPVITELQARWERVIAGEGREAEFTDSLETAARKAVTKLGGPHPVSRDPCLLFGAFQVPAPSPGGGSDGTAAVPGPIEPARLWSHYGEIGTHPFDPQADMDALLADAVLERTWPVLRYAPDAGTWLVRGPEHWQVRSGDLAKWGIDRVSRLMLLGDPNGDPATADGAANLARAKRRSRFMTSGGSNGIAQKMAAVTAAGYHPSTVELAQLDADREVLWAAGMPWDLRGSAAGPALSQWTDPGTVHLHSAAVMPEKRPTPLWDTYTAAVWPDEELRAWALRVLSVAVTGYADKALPILLGESNGGKTQLIMLMMSVLGSYAHIADARLLAPADKSHASIVYALKGRRLSFIDEAPRTGSLATERLKQITGGADLTGNEMRANPVTFSPTHTLILTANPEHEPKLTDGAIRSRTRLIPCDGDPVRVKFARAAIGSLTGPAWRAEAPGVLAFLMGEAARWLADPDSAGNEAAPGAGRAAVNAILAEQDSIGTYVIEHLEPWEAGTRGSELYEGFTESQRRSNVHPSAIPSNTAFGRRLTELGYPPEHRRDGSYRALRVRRSDGWGTLVPGGAPIIIPSQPPAAPGTPPQGENRDESSHHTAPDQATSSPTHHDGESAGQTVQAPAFISGGDECDGSHNIYNAHAHTYTRTHTQNLGSDGSHPITRHTADEDRGPHAVPGQAPLPFPESPAVTEPDPAGPPPADPPAKTPKPKTGEAAAARAAAKAAEKAARLRELEGPVHQLPVLVARNPADPGAPPLVLPCSPEDARQACGQYLDGLCVDVEHTGYSPGRQEYALRLVQLGGEHLAAVLDPDDPAQCEVIRDVLARARWLHAHSAIADLIPLALAGLADSDSLWERMVDSVLIAKLADPALAGSDESQLKKLSTDLLGAYAVSADAEVAKNELFKAGGWLIQTQAQTPVTKSGWAQVRKNCEVFLRYAGADVLDLAAVIRTLRALRPEGGSARHLEES